MHLHEDEDAVGKVEIFVVVLLVTVVVDEDAEAGVLLDVRDELLVVNLELFTLTSNCNKHPCHILYYSNKHRPNQSLL